MTKKIKRKCLNCGKEFITMMSRIKIGKGKYCSKSCSGKINTKRLWSDENYKRHMSEVHKRQIPAGAGWNKGLTKETDKRLLVMSKKLTGKKAWNKGLGNLSEYQRYKNDKKHKEWREAVFAKDNWTCQECGIRSGNGKRVELNADHIKPYALYPELRFDINNGRTLCLDCHYKTETFGGKILNLKKCLNPLTTFLEVDTIK